MTASETGTVRILVVDDHPFFREGLLAWIERQKNFVSCGQADSPSGAIQAVRVSKPDILLLDLQLRGGDGLEVLEALRTGHSPTRAIVLTGAGDTVAAQKALRAGARGYILKHEVSDVLITAIGTVLNGGFHVSGGIHVSEKRSAAPETGDPSLLRTLSYREHQVLQLLGRGMATSEIADELIISPKTVEAYRETLKTKLGVLDSLALVRLATAWEHQGRLGYLR